MSDALLEPYYAAAVRSMGLGWRNFAFGAFDPDGTITLDKLPGAFWLQALSVRLFGKRVWAIVLPQVVEGVLRWSCMSSLWLSIEPLRDSTRLLLSEATGGPALQARLPATPAHERAVAMLLEALVA